MVSHIDTVIFFGRWAVIYHRHYAPLEVVINILDEYSTFPGLGNYLF